MNIRELKRSDIPQLASLYEQFWGEPSDISSMEEQFDIIASEQRHIILAAEADGRVIGSCMGVVCRDLYGDCRPFLVVENMVVDRQYRRGGVGHALLADLEARAMRLGCTQMLLVTEADREDACRFYEAYGFRPDNRGYKKKLRGR